MTRFAANYTYFPMSDSNINLSGIAIVGMAARLPGAQNPSEFWQNLKNGVNSISHFDAAELEVQDALQQSSDPAYVRARAILDGTDLFDAAFFGMADAAQGWDLVQSPSR